MRYLARQGITLQVHNGNENFTQLLYLLGTKDNNIMNCFDGKIGYKYNHHDMENELLNIVGAQVLREKLVVIRDCKFFLIIVGTDISNKQQQSFYVRTEGDNLNVGEDFLVCYEIDNINLKPFLMKLKISC